MRKQFVSPKTVLNNSTEVKPVLECAAEGLGARSSQRLQRTDADKSTCRALTGHANGSAHMGDRMRDKPDADGLKAMSSAKSAGAFYTLEISAASD